MVQYLNSVRIFMLSNKKIHQISWLCNIENSLQKTRFYTYSLNYIMYLFPRYVRCIKPNMSKSPLEYDDNLVLDQLRYLGMLDIIRIRRDGYPIHFNYQDFINRYYFTIRRLKHSAKSSIQPM